jgi:hypothetical protein
MLWFNVCLLCSSPKSCSTSCFDRLLKVPASREFSSS